MKEAVRLIANNKKAYHDYFIDEKFECGIELFGTEVKSIRMGKCSIKEAFVRIDRGEVYVYGMHVNPYEKGNIFNKDPLRARKLLMHRSEIARLEGKIREKGLTLVPLQVYFKGSLVKVEIGLQNDDYAEITSGLSEGDVVLYTASESSSSTSMFGGMNMFGGMGGGAPSNMGSRQR